MHFTGWKLGLKTGMYYLRTQAAAQPIQFTVDQEALRVQDSNTTRTSGLKKRAPPSGSYMSSPTAVPRPMYAKKESAENTRVNGAAVANGIPTPSTTPPPIKVAASAPRPIASPSKPPAFKADVDEGESPKALPTVPAEKVESLKDEALDGKKDQSEDADKDSAEREMDIYSEAVLACESQ